MPVGVAAMVRINVVLPTPLRPSTASACAALQRETDIFEDNGRAVAGGDVREPEDVSHGPSTRLGAGRIHRDTAPGPARAWNLRRRAFDEDLPGHQDGHTAGEAEDDVDVVLDQQHRHRRRQLRNRVEDDGDIGAAGTPPRARRAAGCRARAPAQCAISTMRWTPYGSTSTVRARSSCRHSVVRISDTRASTRARAPRGSATDGRPRRSARATAERDVLLDGQPAKQAGDLECAADARLDPGRFGHAG